MTRSWTRPAARSAGAALLALAGVFAACSGGTHHSGEPPADARGPWHLVFADNFNGSSLDRRRWTTCYDWNVNGCTNAGNHESEWYLPGQVSVSGGAARLTATRATTHGSDGHTYSWSSGMISTGRESWDADPRFTFTHGYVAAAIQVPAIRGMFPALWLMPASRHAPPELDVAEFYNSWRFVQMTVHWKGANGRDAYQGGQYGPVDFSAGYHVFALDWEKNSLTWLVDGVPRYWITDPRKIPHMPMEVLLNLAVGLPTQPPASTRSAQMRVDWVRVWQH